MSAGRHGSYTFIASYFASYSITEVSILLIFDGSVSASAVIILILNDSAALRQQLIPHRQGLSPW